jgi:voltage-gated potassium channel Kch
MHFGIESKGIKPSGDSAQSIITSCSYGLIEFLEALYFSIVTITTLGYGDYVPSNALTRIMASLQALSGLFFTSLFLVALVRRYGRK